MSKSYKSLIVKEYEKQQSTHVASTCTDTPPIAKIHGAGACPPNDADSTMASPDLQSSGNNACYAGKYWDTLNFMKGTV